MGLQSKIWPSCSYQEACILADFFSAIYWIGHSSSTNLKNHIYHILNMGTHTHTPQKNGSHGNIPLRSAAKQGRLVVHAANPQDPPCSPGQLSIGPDQWLSTTAVLTQVHKYELWYLLNGQLWLKRLPIALPENSLEQVLECHCSWKSLPTQSFLQPFLSQTHTHTKAFPAPIGFFHFILHLCSLQ